MDEWQFEMAERLAAANSEEALRLARLAQRVEEHPGFDGEHCVDCDAAIPTPRLRMGKVRCVACQTVIEKRRR